MAQVPTEDLLQRTVKAVKSQLQGNQDLENSPFPAEQIGEIISGLQKIFGNATNDNIANLLPDSLKSISKQNSTEESIENSQVNGRNQTEDQRREEILRRTIERIQEISQNNIQTGLPGWQIFERFETSPSPSTTQNTYDPVTVGIGIAATLGTLALCVVGACILANITSKSEDKAKKDKPATDIETGNKGIELTKNSPEVTTGEIKDSQKEIPKTQPQQGRNWWQILKQGETDAATIAANRNDKSQGSQTR